jgi:hypothetical protein
MKSKKARTVNYTAKREFIRLNQLLPEELNTSNIPHLTLIEKQTNV